MHDFDQRISELVSHDRVIYTRYADDLTFSAARTGNLTGVEKGLRNVLREMRSPSLKINESKTKLATKKYKRFVTGLVLANDGKISIGHDRKRNLRAAVHHASQGKLSAEELVHLSGLLAYVHSVEPEFLKRLVDKFGQSVIKKIKSARKPAKTNLFGRPYSTKYPLMTRN